MTKSGVTPLLLAAQNGHAECLNLLVWSGGKEDAGKDQMGRVNKKDNGEGNEWSGMRIGRR